MNFRDDPHLRDLLKALRDECATAPVEESFAAAAPGILKGGAIFSDLPEVIIAPSRYADAFIENISNTERPHCVLTSQQNTNNHCAILFRHSYRSVRCDIRVGRMTQDAHIGFMRRGDFGEMQTFSLGRSRSGTLQTQLEFVADAPTEIQGIVWRGGLLQITAIHMTP